MSVETSMLKSRIRSLEGRILRLKKMLMYICERDRLDHVYGMPKSEFVRAIKEEQTEEELSKVIFSKAGRENHEKSI